MRAEIITIGDELLIGQVVDTNSAWMAERLNEAGIELYQITSVHDDPKHIVQALDDAFAHADIVLTTGGLGPTKDDITKKVMCDYFHTRLIADPTVEQHVRQLYKDRPDVLNRLTATQWMVPASCTVLENRVGSAPLMVFRHQGKILCAMPGVPYEMKIAMTEKILPFIAQNMPDGSSQIIHRTLIVTGIPESSLAILLEEWEEQLPEYMHLAYLPKAGLIRLRLSAYTQATSDEMDRQIRQLKSIVSDYLIIDEDLPLELAIGQRLRDSRLTIATAESCTGGRLASLFNEWPGSSAWYKGSVIAYSNQVKEDVLGVSHDTLTAHGAVSEQTVIQMAEGVRNLLHADYAIATSGIAGPDGGSPEKPVGTVWIAWAGPQGTTAECYHLGNLREQVTARACQKALVKMLKNLQD